MGLIRNILKRKRSERNEPVVDANRSRCVFDDDDEHPFFRDIWKPRIITWWAKRLLKACGASWEHCLQRKLCRNMRVESACTGLGGCINAINGLGLPVDRIHCSEKDTHLVTELLANHGDSLGCVYEDLSIHGVKRGVWRDGLFDAHAPCKRQDLLILGTPCQPFCKLSHHTPLLQHPLFRTTFGWKHGCVEDGVRDDNSIALISRLQPRAVIFENVRSMFQGATINGKTPGQMFVDDVMSIHGSNGQPLFAAVSSFFLDPKEHWIALSRPRSL